MTKTKAEKKVPVYIPKKYRGDDCRYIAVNGERILVQTNKVVEVPERFAEVIENSAKMDAEKEKFISDNISQ